MRRIDTLERATMAYKALSAEQQREFSVWLRGFEDARQPAKAAVPEKRGRPAGKKRMPEEKQADSQEQAKQQTLEVA